MPPKWKAIGQSTPQAQIKKASWVSKTIERREARSEINRKYTTRSRRTMHADANLLVHNYYSPKYQSIRLWNGTRSSVKNIINNIIETKILNGKFKEDDAILTRISMIPKDMLFQLERLQFPARLAFAMTINKTEIIATSTWTKFEKSILHSCMWTADASENLIFSFTTRRINKNIVYLKTLQ